MAIEQHQRLAQLCKSLGHPARLEIVRILSANQSCFTGTLSSQLPLAASTVSEHLKILSQAGIIQGQIDGPRRCYCLNPDVLHEWQRLVGHTLVATKVECD